MQSGWDLGESAGRSCTLTSEYTVTHGVGSGNRAFHFSAAWGTSAVDDGEQNIKKIEKEELMPSVHQKCGLHLIFRDAERKYLNCRLKRELVKITLYI